MLRSLSGAGLALALGIFAAHAAPPGIEITAPGGAMHTLAPADITASPPVAVAMPGKTPPVMYAGPLLWQVLTQAGAVPTGPRDQAGDIALITGADGYSAAVAVGEISPAFEAKQVILADKAGDTMLPEGHFRLVVPGDAKGARSVRDVVRIAVIKQTAHP